MDDTNEKKEEESVEEPAKADALQLQTTTADANLLNATAQTTISNNNAPTPPTPMSKSQMKRKLRYEKLMAVKVRKKQQEKEAKIAKAKAEGRDLEAERRFVEERTKSGEGNRRRQEAWEKNKLPHALKSFQVCLDCSFESHMTPKEINSLATQIRYCYSNNRWSKRPCWLTVTSLGGGTLEHCQNVTGFDDWSKRAFTSTEASLEEHFKDKLSQVVYLTSDSETTLTELDDNKIYVIGGIVDRNRLRRAAITRAEELGVATAKLPLDEHLKLKTTRVLTVNHVFEILIRYRENDNDWKKALLAVLPHRKEVKAIIAEEEENGGGDKKAPTESSKEEEAASGTDPNAAADGQDQNASTDPCKAGAHVQ